MAKRNIKAAVQEHAKPSPKTAHDIGKPVLYMMLQNTDVILRFEIFFLPLGNLSHKLLLTVQQATVIN